MPNTQQNTFEQMDQAGQIDWLADYIFWSFYFSQGNSGVQNDLDNYFTCQFADSAKKLTDLRGEVAPLAIAKCGRFAASSAHIAFKTGTTNIEVEERFAVISSERGKFPLSVEKILAKMISWDARHLGQGQFSRRSKPENSRFGRSIVLEHLVDGRDARHDVFRKFFAQAVDAAPRLDNESKKKLEYVNQRSAQLSGTQPRNLTPLLTRRDFRSRVIS